MNARMSRRQFGTRSGQVVALMGAGALVRGATGTGRRERLRIGQIGTQHSHAAGKLAAILKYPDEYEVVGVVEPDEARREALKNTVPYRGQRWLTEKELLSTAGLRAVAVETRIEDLVPTAMRCLKAGLNLHVDKPAGTSLEACRAMHQLAAERGLIIQMGYMLRYNPAFQFARRIVREGWLGEITEVSGMMGKYADDTTRRELAAFSGGGLFELACHLVDQVVDLLGAPLKVTSYARRTFPDKDSFADNQLAVLEYAKALAEIRCNHIDPMGGDRRQFSITGTQGTFEIRPLEPQPRGRLGLDRARGNFVKGYQDVPFERPSGRYDEEFLDLGRVLRGEKKFEWSGSHDVATHETVLRASGMM